MKSYASSQAGRRNDAFSRDLELTYARLLGGKAVGGRHDHGVDVTLDDGSVTAIQVKSSVSGLVTFLLGCIEHFSFIPICVGEPGSRQEVIASLQEHGVWIGSDIPNCNRTKMLERVAAVRQLCTHH